MFLYNRVTNWSIASPLADAIGIAIPSNTTTMSTSDMSFVNFFFMMLSPFYFHLMFLLPINIDKTKIALVLIFRKNVQMIFVFV